jgi:hypothetical protein
MRVVVVLATEYVAELEGDLRQVLGGVAKECELAEERLPLGLSRAE